MGLNHDDKIPPVTALEAYVQIVAWYRSIAAFQRLQRFDDPAPNKALINALPAPDIVSRVELKAIFREVISGKMEFGYHEHDGQFKMAAYAFAGLKEFDNTYILNDADRRELRRSRIANYLTRF